MEKNEPTQSKYDAALAKYNTQLDDAEIAAQAARIIAEKVPASGGCKNSLCISRFPLLPDFH